MDQKCRKGKRRKRELALSNRELEAVAVDVLVVVVIGDDDVVVVVVFGEVVIAVRRR